MLIDQVTDPWLLWRLTGKDPRAAFLYVVASENAMTFEKLKALNNIAKVNPEVLDLFSSLDVLQAFHRLVEDSRERGELVSYVELAWVSVYVLDADVRSVIEEAIYYGFLLASDYADKNRKEFKWKLSGPTKKRLAISALENDRVGSKRKMQIALEFGLSSAAYTRSYFKRLLWDKHYDQALKLERCWTDTDVIGVIVENLNSEHYRDAFQIAALFLPHRKDITQELESMARALGCNEH